MLAQLRPGDSLVVWRLDRLGRSLRHLIDTVTSLDERQVGFRSLRENIDTTTAGDQRCSTCSARSPSTPSRSSARSRAAFFRLANPPATHVRTHAFVQNLRRGRNSSASNGPETVHLVMFLIP